MAYFRVRISNVTNTDYIVEAANSSEADELATAAYNSDQTTAVVHRIDDNSSFTTDVSRMPDDGAEYNHSVTHLRLRDIL